MVNELNKYHFIGKKIREARESAKLSQKEIAEKLGYESPTAISYIESGDRKISVVDLEKLAKLLARDIKYFIGQEGERANVAVALRGEKMDESDREAILHIIEMAKNRAERNGNSNQ